ncbi:MAG: hypothetical protein K2W85_04330 [Phycisphaerales bacterium]|nr:hypothetical protein [Phycisphaerales bacterium]
MISPRTLDDRGKPIRIPGPDALCQRGAWPIHIDRRLQLLMERLGLAARGWAVGGPITLGIVVLTAFGWIALIIVLANTVRGVPGLIWIVAFLAGCGVLGWVLIYRARSSGARDMVRITLEEGLCPSCGYNFVGLSSESDGCVPCPECGSCWLESRMQRRGAFASATDNSPTPRLMPRAVRFDGDRSSVLDDHRQRVALVHPWMRRELAAITDRDARKRLKSARRRVLCVGLFYRLAATIIFAAAASLISWAVLHWPGMPLWWGVLMAAGAWAFVAAIFFGNFAYRPDKVKRVMLRRSLCPCCTGPLEQLVPAEDGSVQCPACRAAWVLPKPKSS